MVWLTEMLAKQVLEHKVFLGWSVEPADRGVDSSGIDRPPGMADLAGGRPRGRRLRDGSAILWLGLGGAQVRHTLRGNKGYQKDVIC